MKKIIITTVVLLASSFLNIASAEEDVQALVVDNGSGSEKSNNGKKAEKELICHKGRTLLVNSNSKRLAGHLAHNDDLGECPTPQPPI